MHRLQLDAGDARRNVAARQRREVTVSVAVPTGGARSLPESCNRLQMTGGEGPHFVLFLFLLIRCFYGEEASCLRNPLKDRRQGTGGTRWAHFLVRIPAAFHQVGLLHNQHSLLFCVLLPAAANACTQSSATLPWTDRLCASVAPTPRRLPTSRCFWRKFVRLYPFSRQQGGGAGLQRCKTW